MKGRAGQGGKRLAYRGGPVEKSHKPVTRRPEEGKALVIDVQPRQADGIWGGGVF